METRTLPKGKGKQRQFLSIELKLTWSSSGCQGLVKLLPTFPIILSASLLLTKLRFPLQCDKDGEDWWRKFGPSLDVPLLKYPLLEKVFRSSAWCPRPTTVKVEAEGRVEVKHFSLLVPRGNRALNMTMGCTNAKEPKNVSAT